MCRGWDQERIHGAAKIGLCVDKKNGSRGGKSAGKAKETARAFEIITGCTVGWGKEEQSERGSEHKSLRLFGPWQKFWP